MFPRNVFRCKSPIFADRGARCRIFQPARFQGAIVAAQRQVHLRGHEQRRQGQPYGGITRESAAPMDIRAPRRSHASGQPVERSLRGQRFPAAAYHVAPCQRQNVQRLSAAGGWFRR